MNTHPAIVKTAAAIATAKPRRCAVSVIATAGAFAVGLGIAGAPPAVASPIPGYVQNDYISALSQNGYHQTGSQADELKIGVLLCAINQVGGSPPAGGEPYLNIAQRTGLCNYVDAEAARVGPSLADARQDLQYQLQQANAPGISQWLDVDADDDGVSDANDDAQYDPGYH